MGKGLGSNRAVEKSAKIAPRKFVILLPRHGDLRSNLLIAVFGNQGIDLVQRLGQLVSQASKPFDCCDPLPASQDQEDVQDVLRVPDQIHQVIAAWAARPGKPVLDRPLPRTSPSPDDFDRLMGGTQLTFQSIGDGSGTRRAQSS